MAERERLKREHTPEAVRERLAAGATGTSYLRDAVYGAIDGAVTTFAIVAGVAGAAMSDGVVIVLGLANLLADGFSMAVSNYLGTRAEQQARGRARLEEERHVAIYPEGEREEVRQIFAAKGFEGEQLERVVDVITADEGRWVETMLREEHGYPAGEHSAVKAGLVTFAAFVVVGAVPLLSYVGAAIGVWGGSGAFVWSSVLTGVAFFVVGAVKGRFVLHNPVWSGLETLGVGAVAAGMAYACGVLLSGWLGA